MASPRDSGGKRQGIGRDSGHIFLLANVVMFTDELRKRVGTGEIGQTKLYHVHRKRNILTESSQFKIYICTCMHFTSITQSAPDVVSSHLGLYAALSCIIALTWVTETKHTLVGGIPERPKIEPFV